MFWRIRGRSRGPDPPWGRALAEGLLALGLLAAGFAVSRVAGVPRPLAVPVMARGGASAGRASAGGAASGGAAGEEVTADLFAGEAGRAVLVTAGGSAALIDGGSASVGAAVVAFLRREGIDRVDMAFLTNASAAEADGLVSVIDALPVGRVFDLVPGSQCPAHQAVLAAARAHAVRLQSARRGTQVALGPARVDVLWPAPETAAHGALPANPGVVGLLDGQVRFLFAGNLELGDLDALQRLGSQLSAQVLEVPAGGAAGSLGTGLLRLVSPRVAIVSPGPSSPDPQVLQRLTTARVVTVQPEPGTDLRLITDGRGLSVQLDPGLPGQTSPAPAPHAPGANSAAACR